MEQFKRTFVRMLFFFLFSSGFSFIIFIIFNFMYARQECCERQVPSMTLKKEKQ